MGIAHLFQSAKSDGADATLVQPGDWNADHVGELYAINFSKQGALPASSTGALRWYNQTGKTLTFTRVQGAVGTVSSSGDITVDVNSDGTTIMTGTKLVISASANTGNQTTFSTTTIADGHYVTVDIDAGGTGAADLVVTVWMRG